MFHRSNDTLQDEERVITFPDTTVLYFHDVHCSLGKVLPVVVAVAAFAQ